MDRLQTASATPSGASGREIGLNDRAAGIVAAIDAGETGSVVGKRLGISRERVRQIYTKATGRPIGRHSIGTRCGTCGERFWGTSAEHTTSSVHQDTLQRKAEDRFWAYVAFGEGCWEWTGARNPTGYGHSGIKRIERSGYAHRLAYTLVVGPIPEGMTLDHLCRNRGCVRPGHLEAVTHRENVLRSPIAPAAINARKTHCPKGHPYAGYNLMVMRSGRACRTCRNEQARRYYAKRRARLLLRRAA